MFFYSDYEASVTGASSEQEKEELRIRKPKSKNYYDYSSEDVYQVDEKKNRRSSSFDFKGLKLKDFFLQGLKAPLILLIVLLIIFIVASVAIAFIWSLLSIIKVFLFSVPGIILFVFVLSYIFSNKNK